MENIARTKVASMMTRIYSKRLTTTTGGNISLMANDGDIFITPSGIDKSSLTSKDIAHIHNGIPQGYQIPSSEYPFHKKIFDNNNNIKAIIHAHPIGIVTFSAIRKVPNVNLGYDFQKLKVNCDFAEYALPGSEELADNINKSFLKGSNAVFLENHGIVIGESSLEKAYQVLEHLEACCLQEIYTTQINSKIKYNENHFVVKELESNKNMLNQNNNKSLIEISKRMANSGLIIGSRAVLSERINDNTFITTPCGINLANINEDDILTVSEKISNKKNLNQPLAALIKRIYEEDKDFNAIIIASTLKAMAYSLAEEDINTKIIPEGYILLKGIPTIKSLDIDVIAQSLSKKTPLINVSGNFYVSVGKSLLQAFDRLEVLEFGAESLLYARQFKKTYSISSCEIDKINQKFTGW